MAKKKKTTKRNGIDGADLKPTHDFAWALTQMKKGRTVVRDKWLPVMCGDFGRSETEFVALVPRQEGKAVGDVEAEFQTDHHVKDLLVPAHFVRGTILGLWEPGWTPSTKDLLAEDWKLGNREYQMYCDGWRKLKKVG